MGYVIAVSAPPGGGKSSLVGALAERLGDVTTIHFDSYEKATEKSLPEIVQWMRDGADYDELSIPGLSEDLRRLKNGQAIRDPSSNTEIVPGKYILFETPLGRGHTELARHIDLLLWIDVPLDVALARKAIEFIDRVLSQKDPKRHADFIAWLGGYLDNYLMGIRDILVIQNERIGADADITIDGLSDLDHMADEAASTIVERLP
jgi:uridine kinase